MPSDDAPSSTRRSALKAGAGIATAGLAAGLGATALHEPELPSAPDPETGTWPLPRYGPRNTARSTDATPPDDPTVRSADATEFPQTIVAAEADGERRVLVGGSNGLTAHRGDGSPAWRDDESDNCEAVAALPGTGTCYVAGDALRSRDLLDGSIRWETDAPVGFSVIPTDAGPIVPFNGGVDAYDREGNHRWTIQRGDGIGHAGAAVGDGVYVTDVGMVERLAPRGLVRETRGRPPGAEWRVERALEFGHVPAVDDGEVYVTDESFAGDGGVLALDADGGYRWHRDLGEHPQGAAIGADRVFVAVTAARDGPQGGLFALSRDDGSTEWTDRDAAFYGNPVVAGETLLVTGETESGGGIVRAFDPSGERRWTVEFDARAWAMAPVGDRVYVGTRGGRLHVLS